MQNSNREMCENENIAYSDGYIKDSIVLVAKREYAVADELCNSNVAALGIGKINDILTRESVEKITSYASLEETFAALNAGKEDALVLNELAYLYYSKKTYGEKNEDIKASDIGIEADIYALGAKEETKSVVSAVNEALKSFDESGERGELSDKWFGSRDCLNLQEN